jgi:hypothetical protein
MIARCIVTGIALLWSFAAWAQDVSLIEVPDVWQVGEKQ